MTLQESTLDFYRNPAAITAVDEHLSVLSAIPCDPASLARYVQGSVLHEYWAAKYSVELSEERKSESHIRRASQMLDRILAPDKQPLSVARPPHKRLVGTCRHFSVLLVALLRQQGIPARARCGFATYFVPGKFMDHWVGEYWKDAESRWVRVDAQMDAFQQESLKIDFDPLDVPHDRFVVAGDAWARCRSGEADPAEFGIFDMNGLWFIAANLVRDLAALNNMEMLPWDVWGVMPSSDETLQTEAIELFDQIATITRMSDVSTTKLRNLYKDDRLCVPSTVFNAIRNCPETV